MLDEAPCRKYNALKRTGYELAGGKSRNVPVGGGGISRCPGTRNFLDGNCPRNSLKEEGPNIGPRRPIRGKQDHLMRKVKHQGRGIIRRGDLER